MTLELIGIGPVEVKLEQLQHTGSFKARGAFNRLVKGPVPAAGVVAASGGNHGVALACVPAPGERVAVLVCGANTSPPPYG